MLGANSWPHARKTKACISFPPLLAGRKKRDRKDTLRQMPSTGAWKHVNGSIASSGHAARISGQVRIKIVYDISSIRAAHRRRVQLAEESASGAIPGTAGHLQGPPPLGSNKRLGAFKNHTRQSRGQCPVIYGKRPKAVFRTPMCRIRQSLR